MSSPPGGGDQQPGGGPASSGSRSFTPQTTRYADFQAAHRAITGQDSSEIAEHEFLPDPSVFEDDGLGDSSLDTTAVHEGQLPDPEWFDQAFMDDDADDVPPSGEEIPVSAGKTGDDAHPPAQDSSEVPRDDSHDTVGRIYEQYVQPETNETTSSSGFNPNLAAATTISSHRSASIYRAAPEQTRREGATGRLGFHDQQGSSSGSDTLYDGYSVKEMAARVRALTDSSGPSLPLPNDPPAHPGHVDNVPFGDPSVSSVTNSQALLQGTLSSPPARTYQPGHRAARSDFPSNPPPVPRRSSYRNATGGNDRNIDSRFPTLFEEPTGTRRPLFEDPLETGNTSALPSHKVDEDDDWGGPGPAVVHGVVVQEHSPLRLNPPQPDPTIPSQQVATTTSHDASGAQESSGSSGRDPFHYERLFLAPEQERNNTSRLRTMTGKSTVFSKSPLNSPERPDEFTDVQLDDTREAQAGPSRARPRGVYEGDQRQFLRMARQEDQSINLRRCQCRFPGYECRWCVEEDRIADERARQRDNGPYAASPSYRMDRHGIQVADDYGHQSAFYIGGSPRGYSSTERIMAHPAEHAVTSPSSRPARVLERSDFPTFQAIQRTHRVNGRDETALHTPSSSLAATRRPIIRPDRAGTRLLGLSGSNTSRYEFRDSLQDAPGQPAEATNAQNARRSENWRSLTHPQDLTTSSVVATTDRRATNEDIRGQETPYVIDPNSPTQFPFSLLPLDEARRRQAEDRARGIVDQTFITTSSRQVSLATSSTQTVAAGGYLSTFLSQARLPRLPGRRRAVTRTTGQNDSFSSVMRAALNDDMGQEQVPRAFLPGNTTAAAAAAASTSTTRAAFRDPPPRTFPAAALASSSRRYGNINDDDIEMLPYAAGTAAAAAATTTTNGSVLGRRWSS